MTIILWMVTVIIRKMFCVFRAVERSFCAGTGRLVTVQHHNNSLSGKPQLISLFTSTSSDVQQNHLAPAWWVILAVTVKIKILSCKHKLTLCLSQTWTEALCTQRSLVVYQCRHWCLIFQCWKTKKQGWLQFGRKKCIQKNNLISTSTLW